MDDSDLEELLRKKKGTGNGFPSPHPGKTSRQECRQSGLCGAAI